MKKAVPIISALAILIIGGAAFAFVKAGPSVQRIEKEVFNNAELKSENFKFLRDGLTYEEVATLLGRDGTKTISDYAAGEPMEIYLWTHRPYLVMATFINGRLNDYSGYKNDQLVEGELK